MTITLRPPTEFEAQRALRSGEPVESLQFVKSHGLGNDFVLTESTVSAARARALCDPRRGIGADGVISIQLVESAGASTAARIVIRNADGSRPEMCGNGLRCVVRYLDEEYDRDGAAGLVVQTDAGRREGRIRTRQPGAWTVKVSMGAVEVGESVEVSGPDGLVELRRIDAGNPHAVLRDSELDVDEISALGKYLNDDHQAFPHGVNLEVVRPTATDRHVVVVYERGVGLTDACGSGACAVAADAWREGTIAKGSRVDVELPGGVLQVHRDDEDIVWLTGPATKVFEGRLCLDALEASDF